MRGDFSRIRFNRQKNYTAVLEQQGRVALDADANEQCSSTSTGPGRRPSTSSASTAARPVTPASRSPCTGNKISIGPGRYYVDGLLCENPVNALSYDAQPYLIDLPRTEVPRPGVPRPCSPS